MVMSSVFMHDHNYYFIIILLFSYIHIQKQHYMTSTTYYTIRHNLIAVRRAGIPGQDGSGNRTNQGYIQSATHSKCAAGVRVHELAAYQCALATACVRMI